MNLVDLRNVFASCNDALIEISGDMIYYSEEKNDEGHNSLFLLEYNRRTCRERIISSYFLSNPAFVPRFYAFEESIVLVLEGGDAEVWVMRVEKSDGRESCMAQLALPGAFRGCAALDGSHLVLYAQGDKDYLALTGLPTMACLFDMDDESCCFVRDPRVCACGAENLLVYDPDGEKRLLLTHPHSSEAEKEKCSKDRRWLGDDIRDDCWLCPLFDFIVSVKSGEERVPLELILSAGTEALCRYACMDEKNLYFRVKHFPTNDQRVCAVNKLTGKKSIVANLNLRAPGPSSFFTIDAENGKIYHVTRGLDSVRVEGVLGSGVLAAYPRELGDFIACVEERFLVARYIMAEGSLSYEFHSVCDTRTGKQESYECRCAVHGSTVVLY